MLIWINGAFGSGKTLTAYELKRRLRGAHLADPELLGCAMHKMLPAEARHDFQDLPQWRTGVVATLVEAERAGSGPVIVPMTIVREDYFDEIIGGLRSLGVAVRHYTLMASADTLHRRLRQRRVYVVNRLLGRDETWAIQQIDRCVAALGHGRFAVHVATDDRTPDEVVEIIAADAGLELTAQRLSQARGWLQRIEVGLRDIRV